MHIIGFVIMAILGIVGALVGGFVDRSIGWYGDGDGVGFVMAVLGSIIVLRCIASRGGGPRLSESALPPRANENLSGGNLTVVPPRNNSR